MSIDISQVIAEKLSAKERLVLDMRQKGHTHKEIAQTLKLRDKQEACEIAIKACRKIARAMIDLSP